MALGKQDQPSELHLKAPLAIRSSILLDSHNPCKTTPTALLSLPSRSATATCAGRLLCLKDPKPFTEKLDVLDTQNQGAHIWIETVALPQAIII